MRIRRQTSMPSMSGSIRSRIVSDGGSDETWSSASAPLATVRTRVARVLQVQGDEGRDRALVLDDQDRFRGLRHPERGCQNGGDATPRPGWRSGPGRGERHLLEAVLAEAAASTENLPAMSWMNPSTESTALPLPATLRSTELAFTVSFVGAGGERKRTRSAGPYVQTWSCDLLGMTPGTWGRFVTSFERVLVVVGERSRLEATEDDAARERDRDLPEPLVRTTRQPSPGRARPGLTGGRECSGEAPMERTSKVASTRGRIRTQGIATRCAAA